jgi:hypothetical protein
VGREVSVNIKQLIALTALVCGDESRSQTHQTDNSSVILREADRLIEKLEQIE